MKPSSGNFTSSVICIKVDGVELSEIPSDGHYTFPTKGEHIVEYKFSDNTNLGGFIPRQSLINVYKSICRFPFTLVL